MQTSLAFSPECIAHLRHKSFEEASVPLIAICFVMADILLLPSIMENFKYIQRKGERNNETSHSCCPAYAINQLIDNFVFLIIPPTLLFFPQWIILKPISYVMSFQP